MVKNVEGEEEDEETLLQQVKTKCELPNSCALCVTQFVAQKFDMNQVPRVALAKFRNGSPKCRRRSTTTDARVGHGPEMLLLVLLLLHFRLNQAKNEKLIVEARNVYRSQASGKERRRVSEAATHLVKPQPQRSLLPSPLSLLIRIASAHLCRRSSCSRCRCSCRTRSRV